jgi:glutamate racemase
VYFFLSQYPIIFLIVLGCTHYPLIGDYIQQIVPEGIQVISQGPIVAEKLELYLSAHPEIENRCAKSGKIQFLTSENTAVFNLKAEGFLGIEIISEHVHF